MRDQTGSVASGTIRTFETGATRDTDQGKHDFQGYLSPLVLKRFGEYMTTHRVQPDGNVRASDNWKKGIPKREYLSSLLRHVVDLWLLHEGHPGINTQDIEEALCGALFNAQGYLHENLKEGKGPAPFIHWKGESTDAREVGFKINRMYPDDVKIGGSE